MNEARIAHEARATYEAGAAREARRAVGLITADTSPTLLAVLAHARVDFVVLDAEQTPLDVQACAGAVQRLRGTGVRVSVRVPDLEPNTLVAFANTGVDELVLPHLRSVGELERAREAIAYAPRGLRSRQVSPASGFGTDFSREPVLSVLFETVDAVAEAEGFAACEAFGGGWLGPTDLAADLQRDGRSAPDYLDKAMQSVVETLRGAGHSVGLPAPSMARANEVFARGADRCAVYWERELATLLAGFVASQSA
ncbi:aldolase/citrate lyase family protein [Sinomonas sp. JGH33]|uniref:Aldolase/citrate lyase family protein n=1 Tax=Sinomonas terricola TaxID=3110330 RepID=A0ABU5T8H0_9MICC|nr:aldolase/citrate lyase family protein [Sinomonas sp. JGH33]MEA5455988.1 aldolase/citrate lyase family protein [Sinomonas sp. JGH33]